jgi:hypothetical protein
VLGNNSITTAQQAKNLLTAFGFWTSWGVLPAGMVLYLDSGNRIMFKYLQDWK